MQWTKAVNLEDSNGKLAKELEVATKSEGTVQAELKQEKAKNKMLINDCNALQHAQLDLQVSSCAMYCNTILHAAQLICDVTPATVLIAIRQQIRNMATLQNKYS